MDIIATLEKYNLTLRHLPETVVSLYDYRGRELKENEEIVIKKWNDGRERKMVRETRTRKNPAWICYVTHNWDSIESWTPFSRGATAEDAVKNAVDFIESKNNA